MGVLCVWLLLFPFVREPLVSNWKLRLRRSSSFRAFFLCSLPRRASICLSASPTLMDLSSDRQTARCQLCSVQPDNTAQYRLFPETNGWAARLCLQGTACVCFFCLVWLFVHFSVCPSICGLFPLLTAEINMLKYYINRTDGCTKKICIKNIVTESTSPTNHNHNVGLKKVVKEKKKLFWNLPMKYSSLLCRGWFTRYPTGV